MKHQIRSDLDVAINSQDSYVRDSDQPGSLRELITSRQPGDDTRIAFTFLRPGSWDEVNLTYDELRQRAMQTAAELQRLGGQGERVLILMDSNVHNVLAFFACILAGSIAVPLYVPTRTQRAARVMAVIRDADAKFVLSSETVLTRRAGSFEELGITSGSLTWILIDRQTGSDFAYKEPPPHLNSIAFLQYTSGSTGSPKGVAITHANLLFQMRAIRDAFGHRENLVGASWLPFYHDMGLIGCILQPYYMHARCVIMAPEEFVLRPLKWLQVISKYRVTTSGGPNFAYELCVRRASERDLEQLDLSSWTVAFCGSEPIRADTINRFCETFCRFGFARSAFFPCYGLAEASLLVSAGDAGTEPVVNWFDFDKLAHGVVESVEAGRIGARALVGCGRGVSGQRIEIVQPETLTACEHDFVGEIWVEGPGIAAGYWNQPKLTAEVFSAEHQNSNGHRFLRTGDMGFVHHGQLFVLGRLNDAIVLRGQKWYPEDLEATAAECHPALARGKGAAFLDDKEEQQLIVVCEVDRRSAAELEEVASSIRRAIWTAHGLRVSKIVLTTLNAVPRTSSGKVQRRVCRNKLSTSDLPIVLQWP